MNTRCIFIGGKQLGLNCLKVLLKNNIRPEIVIGNPDDNLEDNALHESLLKYADLESLEIVRHKKLSDPQIICSFNKIQPEIQLSMASWSFVFGIILFSGSLYIIAITGIKSLGIITPIGGILFIIGWVFLILKA